MPNMEDITAMLDKLPANAPQTFLIFTEHDAGNFQEYADYLEANTEVKVKWEDSATIVVVATPDAIRQFLAQEHLLPNLSNISLNEPTFHTC